MDTWIDQETLQSCDAGASEDVERRDLGHRDMHRSSDTTKNLLQLVEPLRERRLREPIGPEKSTQSTEPQLKRSKP